MLERDLLPWVLSMGDLGDDVLEVGPGPGLSTDLLRQRTRRLTALEVDPDLAGKLAHRLAGTNVKVLNRNAEDTGLQNERFSAVACFAVLHHVESAGNQDRIFAELLRVMRPGALFVGSDGYDDERNREAHADDVFVPVDPEQLPARLESFGFTDVRIEHGDDNFLFCARKPERGGAPAPA